MLESQKDCLSILSTLGRPQISEISSRAKMCYDLFSARRNGDLETHKKKLVKRDDDGMCVEVVDTFIQNSIFMYVYARLRIYVCVWVPALGCGVRV